MEIRNNTPLNRTSFGMAFKRPSADKMKDFVNYVGQCSTGKEVKKALTALKKQQAGNEHFDIIYVGEGTVGVVPKTDKAKEIFGSGTYNYVKEKKIETESDRLLKQIKEIKEAHGGKLTRFQKVKLAILMFPKIVVAAIKDTRNPLRALPDNFQLASKSATSAEKVVNAKIAKENTIKSAI